MEWPRLSVVIPNYNHGAYLPDCLNALFGQSVPPFEVIVVDDASTDNSRDVLDRFAREQPTLRVLHNEKNQGALKTALRGLELASGDYIFLPSADDQVAPGFFERSLRLLGQHPRAALSCTISTWYDTESGLKWHMGANMADRPGYLSPDDLVRLGRRGKLSIPTSGAILRKGPMLECGGYLPELYWHADWFVTAVPAFRYGLCFIPEPLSDVYQYPDSFYHRGRRSARHREVLQALLDKLNASECADVAPRVRDSAALALFGLPLVRLVARGPKYRKFLTWRLVAQGLRRSLEELSLKILPRWLIRLTLRLFYHHPNR